MEVDSNELLHRIGAVLRGISDKLDRLVELATDHFADANKMVAEEPAKEPPEPEYRAPVLPWDAGKVCEFSMTGKDWYEGMIVGFQGDNKHPWMSSNLGRWNFARIKKDA